MFVEDQPAPRAGDVIRIEASLDTIEVFENGQISIETTGIIPEFRAVYETASGNVEQINQQAVFTPPANVVDSSQLVSWDIRGQSLFNSIVGGEAFQTTTYATEIRTMFTNLTFKQDDVWFFGVNYNPLEGSPNAFSGQIRITAPANVTLLNAASGSDSNIHTFTSDITATNIIAYGPNIDDGSGRIANWSNLYGINLTAQNLESKTADEINNMIAAGYFEEFQHVQGATINSIGKNIFDKDSPNLILNNGLAANNVLVSSSISHVTPYIRVQSGSNYTISNHTDALARRVAFVDSGLNFVSELSLSGTSSTFAVPEGASFLRFSVVQTNLNIAQLERGTVATDYEAHRASTAIVTTQTLRSVPNGQRDNINYDGSVIEHNQNVQEYDLVSGDIIGFGSGANVDFVTISKPTDFIYHNTTVGVEEAFSFGIYSFGSFGGADYDDVANVNKISARFNSTLFVLIVAQGTYANLAAAQADLAGTTVLYQLADTVTTILDFNRLFFGVCGIPRTPKYRSPKDVKIFRITCGNANAILARRTVRVAIRNVTITEVVQLLFDEYISDENITLGTIDNFDTTFEIYVAPDLNLRDVLNELANFAGAAWNVTNDYVFNFFSIENFPEFAQEINSQFLLGAEIQHKTTDIDLRTAQTIRGVRERTIPQTEIFTYEENNNVFTTNFPLAEKPMIDVNGTPVPSDRIGVQGLDSDNPNIIFFFANNSRSVNYNVQSAFLNIGDTVTIEYIGTFPVSVTVLNAEKIDEIAARTGTSGRIDNTIIDTTLSGTIDAQNLASSLLANNDTERGEIDWWLTDTVLKSRNLTINDFDLFRRIDFNLPDLCIVGSYVIVERTVSVFSASNATKNLRVDLKLVDRNFLREYAESLKITDRNITSLAIRGDEVIVDTINIFEEVTITEELELALNIAYFPTNSLTGPIFVPDDFAGDGTGVYPI